MAKIIFLGTCSGTEPIGDMHHTSFVVQVGDVNYFFDAGENCSRTSRAMGVDLLKVPAIFISHPHIDHVGGLMNLVWSIKKLRCVTDCKPINNKIDIYIPDINVMNSILDTLRSIDDGFETDYSINVIRTMEKVLYEDENIKVSAVSNHHLGVDSEGLPLSYSYIIETEGKKIVFSGDVRDLDDVERLTKTPCDYLLMETGHHKVSDILNFAKNHEIGKLLFIHHGREIINNREDAQNKISESNVNAQICHDKIVIEIPARIIS
ncbi:MAG: MBL fold metallo-hydrolase [Clostridia bacterium]|nr:MBL fold metallo-hydrolase [Clostridia bacterium]